MLAGTASSVPVKARLPPPGAVTTTPPPSAAGVTVTPGAAGTAEAAPTKTYTAQGPVAMRASGVATAKVIRTLPAGAIVYPTGTKAGLWWEVADENDNVGWVLNTKLAPSN